MKNAANAQNKTRRLVLGFILLLVVDVLWVASSELTRYIFQDQHFKKPFLTTYLKTCMFSIYLLGFVFHRPWRDQCLTAGGGCSDQNGSEDESGTGGGESIPFDTILSEPHFEPIRCNSDCGSEKSSVASSDNESKENSPTKKPRIVRFNKVQEVRKMPEAEAEAAILSRLPYELWLRATSLMQQFRYKLPIRKVAKLSLQFSILWFIGNLAYQEALVYTEAGVVNVLSSTSSLFTLVFAAIFPSCSTDKFTLSKLCAVMLSVAGVSVVTWVDEGTIEVGVPSGVIWALVGAIGYAVYLVMLRRRVDSEDKLDIPMFFGFVGLFCMILLWPVLYILHATEVEPFYPLPNRTQLIYITVNGLLGTVLSEYLWLWGCFLTSSLIATLSLSLTVPMTVIMDRLIRRNEYPWSFYLGALPVVLSFFAASLLAHYDNWDPVYIGLRKLIQKLLYAPYACVKLCRRPYQRLKDLDREQGESLIVNS